MPEVASTATYHGGSDFSRVRVVNLGTGTKSEELPPRQRDRLASFVPSFIRMSLFLKRTLTEIAIGSENEADVMDSIAVASSGDVSYERFSADNGVCYIKMDKYKELHSINDLTTTYIRSDATQARLKKVGEEIAMDYLSKHRPKIINGSAPSNSLTVPDPNGPSSQNALSQTPETSEPGTSGAATTDSSCGITHRNTENDTNGLEHARDAKVSLMWATSPDTDTRELSAMRRDREDDRVNGIN